MPWPLALPFDALPFDGLAARGLCAPVAFGVGALGRATRFRLAVALASSFGLDVLVASWAAAVVLAVSA